MAEIYVREKREKITNIIMSALMKSEPFIDTQTHLSTCTCIVMLTRTITRVCTNTVDTPALGVSTDCGPLRTLVYV